MTENFSGQPAGVTERINRYWEIDVGRGVACVMMVCYHFLFLLSFYYGYQIEVLSGFWRFVAFLTGTLFLFIVGVATHLRYQKLHTRQNQNAVRRQFCRRGLMIFFFGLFLTLVTRVIIPNEYIRFGILHLIGVSVILSYFFQRFRLVNFFLGVILIFSGLWLYRLRFNFDWLFWLGLIPYNFSTLDYYPLVPWFGVILLGIFFSQLGYPAGIRRFWLPAVDDWPIFRALAWLGQRSLIIYLIHIPIIFGLIQLFFLTGG